VRNLTHTLQRLDPTAEQAVRQALRIADAIHCLRVAHLIAGLLTTDAGLVLRKLRRARVDRADLIRQVYVSASALSGADPSDPVGILLLAGTLARPGVRINTQHLLAAILLADDNPVAASLTQAGIDRHLFVHQQFAHLFAVDEALQDLARAAAGGLAADTSAQDAAVLQAWAAERMPAPPAPEAPPATRVEHDAGLPERTARQWLRKLLSAQAEQYDAHGYLEVGSTLIPGRSYRIYRDGCFTSVYEAGREVAGSCLKLRNPSLPPTDRVIAEYFLIRGDEDTYLTTANIVRR